MPGPRTRSSGSRPPQAPRVASTRKRVNDVRSARLSRLCRSTCVRWKPGRYIASTIAASLRHSDIVTPSSPKRVRREHLTRHAAAGGFEPLAHLVDVHAKVDDARHVRRRVVAGRCHHEQRAAGIVHPGIEQRPRIRSLEVIALAAVRDGQQQRVPVLDGVRQRQKALVRSERRLGTARSSNKATAHQTLLGNRVPVGPTGPSGPILKLTQPAGAAVRESCSGVLMPWYLIQ